MKSYIPSVEVWDEVAKTYDLEISEAELNLAQEINKIIKEISESKKEIKLIELGSGSGHLSAVFAREGYDVTLLDFSTSALAVAKKTFELLNLEGDFIHGDLLDYSFSNDQIYDIAWNSGVMEHFDENSLSNALKVINNINAKYYIFIVPNAGSIPYILFRYKTMASGEWIWGKEFLRTNYGEVLEKEGYTIIGERYLGASFSEQHLKYILGDKYELPFSDMVEFNIIPKSESYLKAYIVTKDVVETKELIERSEVDIEQLKTEIFDLNSQINYFKNLNSKIKDSESFYIQERDNLLLRLNSILEDKNNLVYKISSLEKQNDELEDKVLSLESKMKKNNELNEKESTKLLKQIHILENEKKQLFQKNNIVLDHQRLDFQEQIDIIRDQIIKTANTKPYRLAYSLRRFKHQFIKGNRSQRKDFVKWNLDKVKGKPSSPNLEYNLLHRISSSLHVSGISNNYANVIVQENEDKVLKTKKSIFIFATVPYYDIGGGQRSAQLAKTFDKMGYIIHYIYAYEASDGSNRTNLFIPAVTHESIDNYSNENLIKNLTEENIFIFEAPIKKFEQYLFIAKKYNNPIVYEHIDNWETSLGSNLYNEETFIKFIIESDCVLATSKLLKEKLENYIKEHHNCINKNIEVKYLPNAVDSDLFEQMIKHEFPSDLVRGKKTLLYYGSLWGDWFDWDIIKYVALNRPEYQINLIGDFEPIEHLKSRMPNNVHFLGLKKQTELPAYLEYCDVAIIPFKNDEIGKYVSPLKIFEYISMGKKVISTKLPDIEGYPNVYCSDFKEEWLSLIDSDSEINEFDVFVLQNNWYSRCRSILENSKKSEKINKISIIILNRNNKKTIFKCVRSLLHFNTYNYEVIVVDNQSTDGSYEMLEEEFGDSITLLKNSKNGCSSGRNLGVEHSKGDLLFFLDSDQWIIESNWLDNAISIINSFKAVGAVGWNAGWFDEGSVEGPIVDYYENRAIKSTELFRTDVTYLATSGLLMTKKVFAEIQGFDEFYDPTCFEDTDLSLKIKHSGYKLAYCPYMSIFHLPHQTTNSGSSEHKKRMERNGEYFLDKWNAINPSLLNSNS